MSCGCFGLGEPDSFLRLSELNISSPYPSATPSTRPMSRRPAAYDDLDQQPRGSARADPTYDNYRGQGSGGGYNSRPARPRAEDYMQQPDHAGGRDQGSSRAPPPPPRDYGRDRNQRDRSRSPRRQRT